MFAVQITVEAIQYTMNFLMFKVSQQCLMAKFKHFLYSNKLLIELKKKILERFCIKVLDVFL